MTSGKKVGRPASDEVSTEAAKQVLDAKKIISDETTDNLLERANAMLENTAKTTLLNAAIHNAKKAEVFAKRELEEAKQEDEPKAPRSSGFKMSGMSPEDIRTIAESLPEDKREGFIRQSLGMQPYNSPLGAFMQSKAAPAATAPAQNMSFSDTLQAMMGMMTMTMTQAQMKADEWRQQQEYEEKAHRRRMEELREARGGTQQDVPNPQLEALKIQMEFYKDTIKEYQATIKEMAANKPSDAVDEIRKENFELTKSILEGQKAQMEEKVRSMEARLGDANRNTMNLGELIKTANANGANLHQGDTTDLQLQNEHDYKMEELRIRTQEAADEREARRAEAEARAAEAHSQTELFKSIATEVGKVVVQSRLGPAKDLSTSSPGVKSIVGAMQ
jgi:hypothetical protein